MSTIHHPDYYFRFVDEDNRTIYRIKYKGRFVKLDSKKTAWSKIGHAKNALINHLQYRFGHTEGNKMYDELMCSPDLEFVQC